MDWEGAPPRENTLERWAWDLVLATSLEAKLAPPSPPDAFEAGAPARRLSAPGRPPELVVMAKGAKTPKPGGLRDPRARARLLHTFFHHELQAAELFAWALLAFPDTPEAFRRGLVRLARDELRHAQLYVEAMADAGFRVGDFPVRDWFWERLPACETPLQFVAALGLGFEGGNLEHTATWAERFRAAGDDAGAAIQERIGREEIAHVAFARRWFAEWTGGVDFDRWVAALPPPLSPMVMRGVPVARAARGRAGLPDTFLDRLEAWTPSDLPPSVGS